MDTHAMGGIVPMRDPGRAGTLPTTSDELSRLLTAVRRGRVLTVTGRFREPRSLLVREIAERLSSNFCDGVAVIVVDRPFGPRELTAALGCVPGMPFLPCGTADAVSWLAERDMLLVLDGTDHLAPETLTWLRNLLTAAPGLRILAAGRSPLAFEGERVHRL
ncbi:MULTISPECIES: hypothetical protein [unclassified Streptomyces]|uniref:hypothetical protein n=1 Tax=unclassified Streptomyces TaxID=2593676 RepID=UPI002E0FD9C1|nr:MULTISPECIES: hypothetical protein [unclassified Streptomyces]WSR22231.1 hypothetical protein OG573_25940 [Streptomyces sp. NBC_01205]